MILSCFHNTDIHLAQKLTAEEYNKAVGFHTASLNKTGRSVFEIQVFLSV